MPEFAYVFRKKSTGRPNKGRRSARSEDELRSFLALAHDVDEVLSVEKIPPRPATGPQLDYLKDLGVKPPVDVTIIEASDLIDNAVRQRSPGNDRDRELAEFYGLDVSRFASRAAIYDKILGSLQDDTDQMPLAQWFVYRVYRSGFDRSSSGGIESPDALEFKEIAEALVSNQRALRSLKAAATSTMCAFRWFGEITGSSGEILVGDSQRTLAYQFARDRLVSAGLIRAGGSGVFIPEKPSRSSSAPAAQTRSPYEAYEPVEAYSPVKPPASSNAWLYVILLLICAIIYAAF